MTQRVVLLLSVFLFASPAAIWACACSQAPPGACAGLQKEDVVFLGTMVAMEKMPAVAAARKASDERAGAADSATANSDAPTGQSANSAGTQRGDTASAQANPGGAPVTRYHFRIDERFAGPETTEIDVFSGGDDGDCGYQFEKGKQYIVFTQQEESGQLFSTICNGTRPASDGRALLPQLRAMRNGQRVASVFGVLHRSDPPFLAPADDPDDPLPNISLKLRSHDDRFETSTGPEGIYSFYDVHAGEYQFTANLPVRMQLTQKTLTGGLPPFKIPNGACYEYDVDALPTGHIRGSVVGPDGKPLPLASVEIYRAGQYKDSQPGLWGFQGVKGEFDFDHVGPGEYILVYNRMDRKDPNSPFPRTFYPGTHELEDAQPIRLKDGQALSKIKLKLDGGLPTRLIHVRLKWEHAKPPGDITVMAKAQEGNNPAAQKLGDDVYQFTLLASDRYTVSAWEDLLPHVDPRGPIGAAGTNATACAAPARIDTEPVAVDASDQDIKEVTLTFGPVGCAQSN